ncbi:MAG: DUF1254 domain-containing protein [Alphaproteobacteria bacterium]|nr:DUF1254 domain-containing protein [Alphaproteobacteria bacterium]
MILRWLKWGAFTLVLAAAVHWSVVAYAPTLIMWRAMAVAGGKDSNTVRHGDRATAAARAIVKPSPDLLYSTCVFDVSRKPLRVTTAAPQGTYWSVAFYAANTDNFFVLNDKQANSQPAKIVLIGQGQTIPPQPEGTIVVSAPTTRGIVLFRTLINDDVREPELDRERRAAKCESM